jgi:Arc/MetJ-type ribon-helix-helix transcriptional regulator
LPEPVARFAQAEVAAGHYPTVEDVLTASVEALRERAEAEKEWLAYARNEATEGFAELDRGEGISGTVDEHMARIDAAVRSRVAERSAK